MNGGFGKAAPVYRGRGWAGVLPFHDRESGKPTKAPPLPGFTGHNGTDASDEQVAAWTADEVKARANIGVRLPDTVIGIDVDAYGEKQGGKTFAQALTRLGNLPLTWTSSSRDDDEVSGIRFFRVPAGRAWADKLGPDVEIVWRGHRYAIVSPSVHPGTGQRYKWRGPDGQRTGTPPRVGDLPPLPPAWIEELGQGSAAELVRTEKAEADEAAEFLGSLPPGPPCPVVREVVGETVAALKAGGSRHDTMRNGQLSLLGYAARGHRGGREGLAELETAFDVATSDRGNRGEWDRALLGAIGKLVVEAPGAWRCCDDQPPPAEEWFWTSRERLSKLRDYARAARVAPWAMLGAVLGIVASRIGPKVVLPPLGAAQLATGGRGGIASLNVFIGLVGAPGSGKDVALEAAEAFLWLEEGDLPVVKLGTGQGVAAQYTRQIREKGKGTRIVQFSDVCLFVAREVDTLAAHSEMGGSNLLATLKDAYSGVELGEGYAKLENRRPVRKHQYRAVLVCGIQPSHAGAILADADGGFPQRWLWFLTNDPDRPRGAEGSDELLTANWVPPRDLEPQGDCGETGVVRVQPHERIVLDVCQVARDEGEALRERALDLDPSGPDGLDGHAHLTQRKVAALLSIFDARRGAISEDDWKLAGVVMAHSRMARRVCERAVAQKAEESNRQRAKAEGVRRAIAADAEAEAVDESVTQASKRVLAVLDKVSPKWVTSGALRAAVKSEIRRHVERVVGDLTSAGLVEAEEYAHGSGTTTRYRRAGTGT